MLFGPIRVSPSSRARSNTRFCSMAPPRPISAKPRSRTAPNTDVARGHVLQGLIDPRRGDGDEAEVNRSRDLGAAPNGLAALDGNAPIVDHVNFAGEADLLRRAGQQSAPHVPVGRAPSTAIDFGLNSFPKSTTPRPPRPKFHDFADARMLFRETMWK